MSARGSHAQWGGSLRRGDLSLIADEKDLERVGHCWARGALSIGSVLVCLAHSGDWFFDFLLLEPAGVDTDGSLLARADPRPLGAYELKVRIGSLCAGSVDLLARGAVVAAPGAQFPPEFRSRAEALALEPAAAGASRLGGPRRV